MQSNAIPKRSEVPEELTWNLSDLFESDSAWLEEYEAMQQLPARLEEYRGRLEESPEMLLGYFKLQDEISLRAARLRTYANCRSDEDTANNLYQDLKGRAGSVLTAISSAGAFAAAEIMALPQQQLEDFFARCPGLSEYRRSIQRIRRRASHILPPEQEKLLAAAGEMAGAAGSIGNVFRNADLTFPSVEDSQGVSHPLSNGSFVPLQESPDREFRRRVFETYYGRIADFRNTAAATLDAQFKQLRYFAGVRGYKNTLEASLDATEVPEQVYHSLIEAVHRNLPAMYRYVALRRRMLGVDELHMYDVYAPMVPEAAADIPFQQAKDTVLKALGVLGEDYTAILREGFENRWIDVLENQGKRSGAYSTGGARPHPYVLLNYKNTLDNQFTLAHEMGHALHSYHSSHAQPVSTSGYVIFVAEVASTCNEVLLMRYLLERTEGRRERAYLINHFLDTFKGTLYRQTMFAEFELAMGRMSERGETLTAEALSREYLRLNQLYFGPDMVSDPGIAVEWARIPHFFYNYYVFQYATGFSAAVAIANRIRDLGAPAVEDYKRFLSAGSSADPISLLRIAGVDMSTPQPVDSALGLFRELVEELEKLAD